jgi:hypothetical protein
VKKRLAFIRKVRGLLPWAGVPFTEVIASQVMAWPKAVTSSCGLGIIEIELSIHSLEIMAWDALFSCPFLRKPLLGVADKMREPCFKGLTSLYGGRQWVCTQAPCDALGVECDSCSYLTRNAGYVG